MNGGGRYRGRLSSPPWWRIVAGRGCNSHGISPRIWRGARKQVEEGGHGSPEAPGPRPFSTQNGDWRAYTFLLYRPCKNRTTAQSAVDQLKALQLPNNSCVCQNLNCWQMFFLYYTGIIVLLITTIVIYYN